MTILFTFRKAPVERVSNAEVLRREGGKRQFLKKFLIKAFKNYIKKEKTKDSLLENLFNYLNLI